MVDPQGPDVLGDGTPNPDLLLGADLCDTYREGEIPRSSLSAFSLAVAHRPPSPPCAPRQARQAPNPRHLLRELSLKSYLEWAGERIQFGERNVPPEDLRRARPRDLIQLGGEEESYISSDQPGGNDPSSSQVGEFVLEQRVQKNRLA
ncbi:hypothetical protein NDU88_000704 [Pleurodeles waltl]|uniref:Uncharacterized protein n=1 Tax=Pleurodeles waltl TaxID=8319 RepID=A0AAV7P3L5_PLEWA|nr:hypothetical protein NDU88_000704 [Pleurodeles waltl]